MAPRKLLLVLWAGALLAPTAISQDRLSDPKLLEVGDLTPPKNDLEASTDFLQLLNERQQSVIEQYREALADIAAVRAQVCDQILSDPDASDDQFALAAAQGLSQKIRTINRLSDVKKYELFRLVQRQLSIGLERGINSAHLNNANTLCSNLERYGDEEMAVKAYKTFLQMLREEESPATRRYIDQFTASIRRLRILGSKPEIVGKLIDGAEFDWDKYRGKVVLVDFWATWSGPCIAEAPNLRRNYDEYHARGFEVVGINLDKTREALESYIERNNVPWPNLFEDGAGGQHPLAMQYGVSSIPTVWLINREGRVVSTKARGQELGRLLGEMLNTPEDLKRAIASYNERLRDDPDNVELLRRHAEAHISLENWNEAEADWDRIAVLAPARIGEACDLFRRTRRLEAAVKFGKMYLDQSPDSAERWLRLAPYLLKVEGQEAFAEFCADLVEQFDGTQDARNVRLICKICSLAPGNSSLKKLPREALERSTAVARGRWQYGINAMLALRDGEAKKAVELVTKSEEYPSIPMADANHLPILAMAQYELGKKEAARTALKKAAKQIEALRSSVNSNGYHDLLMAELLLEEAQSKIND